MSEARTSHSSERTPPTIAQAKLIPAVLKLKDAYRLWQQLLQHSAKTQRRTLGEKIDFLFLETLEYTFRASYLTGQEKAKTLDAAVTKLDLVKFFLLIGWEVEMITDKQYAHLLPPVVEASKMLVGWKAYLEKKTPLH